MAPKRSTRFQSFEDRTNPADVAPRLKAVRAQMEKAGIDAFLVPRADMHRGETVPPSEERLAWLTGFTGSAGLAIVARQHAALFVDGRYTLQAPAQTDTEQVSVIARPPGKPEDWLRAELAPEATIGFDPWLHTKAEIEALEKSLRGSGLILAPVANPVTSVWLDRPAPPAQPVTVLDDARAGASVSEKLALILARMRERNADALVLTLPESLCWLFNIRGNDVAHTPVVLGFAVLPAETAPLLFLNPAKVTAELRQALNNVAEILPDAELTTELDRLGKAGAAIWIDPQTCPVAISSLLEGAGAKLVEERDPVLLVKAAKNPAEIEGMRNAHRLDGVAMARFLAWFDATAPAGGLTEIDIVERLELSRRRANSLVDISFETIAGSGPHGAFNHYRVTETTNRELIPGELMLVDSGGQYREGTTDITRTMATGPVTELHREAFTRVLKGMIAVSTVKFPKGTTGQQIDTLARAALWQAGMDYAHGTGHGVGAYLGVHEGPGNISPRPSVPLEPGMILSNEPGYYLANEFGIRIENLILVVESPVGTPEREWYEFETLTLAPIDTRLIQPGLLTTAERDWLNAYHARVLAEIGPQVEPAVLEWLTEATRPV